jgi:hypothetical protein
MFGRRVASPVDFDKCVRGRMPSRSRCGHELAPATAHDMAANRSATIKSIAHCRDACGVPEGIHFTVTSRH